MFMNKDPLSTFVYQRVNNFFVARLLITCQILHISFIPV